MAATYFCCKGGTFIGFVCFIFAVRLLKVVKHKTLPLNTSSSNEIRLVGASKRVPQTLLLSLSRVANKLKLKYAVHKVLWQHATVWAFWNVFQLFLSSLHWAIERAALCFVLYATIRFRFGSVLVSQCVAFFHFLAFGFEGFNQDWRLTHVAPFLCLSFGDENFSFAISFVDHVRSTV